MKTVHIAAAALLAGLGLVGCKPATSGQVPPLFAVTASDETAPVGEANEDAADDPAIWRNAADPTKSLIVATDKKAGVMVYDLSGKRLFADHSGRVNNVDLADMGAAGVIVVASDRNDKPHARLRIWRLDTGTGALTQLGTVPGGEGEGYGLCLWKAGDGLHAFSVLKSGLIEEYRLTLGAEPTAERVREMKLASQAEGCVADPRDGTFYVGEEDVAIWRFAPGATTPDKVAPVDDHMLTADIEGVTLLPEGANGGYLIASSQGDSTYAVFRLPDVAPVGHFRIAAGRFGSTEETDGVAVDGGSFGPLYPGGLFVAQDGHNAPNAQNFKLVPWAAIRAGLPGQTGG